MKVRLHRRRRTALAVATAAGLLAGLVAFAAPGAALAATPTAVGTGTVKTGGTPLNMRSAASSASARMGTVNSGGTVAIVCQVTGENVTGAVRTTRAWDRLTNGSYVSDGYVVRGSFRIPACTAAPVVSAPVVSAPPATAGQWMLPVTASLVSGFRTPERPNHDGIDLGAARNTPIHAAAAGTVIRVTCNVSAGSCDVDGNRTLSGCGWYTEVQHAGGIVTRYCHMVRRPSVIVGQVVAEGQILGYVGMSGSASGPHLHFEVHSGAPATKANAISPITFLRTKALIVPGS